MLTQAVLDKQWKLNNKSDLFATTGTGIYTSGASIYNSLINRSITHKDNLNLDSTQRELNTWHSRWSHCNLDCCQMILARPHQKKDSESRGEFEQQMVVPIHPNTSSCAPFWCPTCLYAKQRRKNPASTHKTDQPELEGVLTENDTQPGDKVCCDQYMSPTKVRLMNTRGKESALKQLCGGTIFVDHTTNFIFNNHKTNLSAVSIVASKHNCKSKLDEFGIQIKQYASDNHPFCS